MTYIVKGIKLCLLLLLSSINLDAQIDTSIALPSIEVIAPPLRKAPIGGRSSHWDSTAIQNSSATTLAELLSREGAAFVKSYGMGSLATLSLRGASSGQTAISWNGFRLQSPMLGQLDLSLFPSSIVDNINLEYGGNATLWGNGAIGGLITLQNEPKFGRYIETSFQSIIGSFGRTNQQVQLDLASARFNSSTRVFYQSAENDFTYSIRPDLPLKQQTHAAVFQKGILQELYFKINDRQTLGWHFWKQSTDREIPPTTVQNRSAATQEDYFTRTSLYWQFTGKDLILNSKAAYFNEYLNYNDSLAGIQSNSQFKTIITELDGQWQYRPSQFFYWGLNHTYTKVFTDAYLNFQQEHRIAAFSSIQQKFGTWKSQLSIRQEWIAGQAAPPILDLRLDKIIFKQLQLKAKLSRNYRFPTFNDRFWLPGGQADLLPEKGWSQEITMHPFWKMGVIECNYTATLFNRSINNWILWSIRPNESFWSANNIAKVWSRGLEQRLTLSIPKPKWAMKLQGGYDYIRSTNQIAIQIPNIKAGEQLLYVPIHQAFGSLHLNYKRLSFFYRQTFTGMVAGINADLESYTIADSKLQYTFSTKKLNAKLFLQINNIWDTNYRVIERRPMPGRYYDIGLFFSYKKQ